MLTPARRTFSMATLGFRVMLWSLVASVGSVAMGQDVDPDGEPVSGQDIEQDVDHNGDSDRVPYRVARLSFAQGGVSLQAVGETQWIEALVNRPLVPGDYLRTDAAGRAELQVDAATVRLGSGSNFTILNLDDRAFRMRVTAGVINVRVRDLLDNETVEIETPQATASILRPGNYRLEVSASGDATVVKVSNGMLEARGPGDQGFVVRPQQVATLTGTSHLAYRTAILGAPDSFDEWNLQRDQEADRALSTDSAKYVSTDTVGYEQLDEYGSWQDDPEYGYVWAPTRVVAGWSPYRYGRYSYVSGWGWSWIDDAPWGFAPYHYGNWVTIGGRWCWVPGARHGRFVGGRPDRPPSHGWHIQPTPPRGAVARNIPRNPNRGDGNAFNRRDGDRASNTRFRTRPPGNDNNYSRNRPNDNRPYDNGQSGVPVTVAPSAGIPPSTGQPGEDRRMRIPRNERPQSTFQRTQRDRDRTSSGGRGPIVVPSQPRQEQSRPQPSRPESSRPQQPRHDVQRPEATRPAPAQPQQPAARPADNGSRASLGRGDNGARSPRNSRER